MKSVIAIQKVDARLGDIVGEDLPILKKVKEFVIKSGGKRIRPLIHYYLASILGYRGKEWIDIGAIGELIHAASLLHDDVIDEASTRRGKSTINTLHGNKTAILAGDYLLACALDHLAKLSRPVEFTSIFTHVVRMLSIGELLQMEWERNLKTTEATYERVILGKTASLFGAMSQSAALLAGFDKKQTVAYRDFGLNMGRIFQVRDDYLDYFGTLSKDGKQPLADFHRGLVTLPLLQLQSKMDRVSKKQLEAYWKDDASRNEHSAGEFILNLFDQTGVRVELQSHINAVVDQLSGQVESNAASEFTRSIVKNLQALKV